MTCEEFDFSNLFVRDMAPELEEPEEYDDDDEEAEEEDEEVDNYEENYFMLEELTKLSIVETHYNLMSINCVYLVIPVVKYSIHSIKHHSRPSFNFSLSASKRERGIRYLFKLLRQGGRGLGLHLTRLHSPSNGIDCL